MYAVLFVIAALNLYMHRKVIFNLTLRDSVESTRHTAENYELWRHDLHLLISETLATGHAPALSGKQFQAPQNAVFSGSQTLVQHSRILIDSIRMKERYVEQSEKEFDRIRLDVIRIYKGLDKKIATVLAKIEMNEVLGIDVSDQSSLAPYVLKSLNQLSLIALNALMKRDFTEDDSKTVAFNRQFLESQLYIIDNDRSIIGDFDILFARIDYIRTLIAEQKQTLLIHDARIAKHKKTFYETYKKTEPQNLVNDAKSRLFKANTSLMNASKLTLLSALLILLFVPLFVIGTGIIGTKKMILRPIHKLTETIQNFEQGHLADSDLPERKDEIGRLVKAFNSMAAQIRDKVNALDAANRKLSQNEAKYRLLAENSEDIIFTLDKNLRCSYVSPSVERILGFVPSEVLGKTVRNLIPGNSRKNVQKVFQQYQSKLRQKGGSEPNTAEVLLLQLKRKEGALFWAEMTVKIMSDEKGAAIGILGLTRDISDRKSAEERLITSLREKETLLREVNHRTKNNMSIISSILELQGAAMNNRRVDLMVKDCTTRIRTMALAHEMLYKGKNLSRIDMREYIAGLTELLINSSGVPEGKIRRFTDIENISLLIDIAIPCGLMINEILTNSIKYAFPGKRKGTISVIMKRSGKNEVTLIIGDDGVGVAKDIGIFQTKSLGLQLVREIATAQLHGSISANTDSGLVWQIKFRDDLYKERIKT